MCVFITCVSRGECVHSLHVSLENEGAYSFHVCVENECVFQDILPVRDARVELQM